MKNLGTVVALFAVIILEGYVVLSTELLAIRQSFPFSGSGTETISVIIAAVLMPLAFGYYYGGKFKPTPGFGIRQKLISNILISMAILLPGMSYVVLTGLYTMAADVGLGHRLILVSLHSAIFLIIPVYLLGQTIPLISHYFGKQKLPRITGRILFASTLGSFMGAVFSTLVLMSHIGVNNTVSFNFIIMAGLIILLSKNKLSRSVMASMLIALTAIVINSNGFIRLFGVVENNLYNTIAVLETPDANHLFLNNSSASKYGKNGEKYAYVEFAENVALAPLRNDPQTRDILVIGAGAFTFGYEDTRHNYDFVDIDGSLQRISEDYILPEPLGENKHFHALPARAFLAQTDKKYDVIFLDAYFGLISLPEQLVTVNFFNTVKNHMKENGVLVANFIASPNFIDPFSRNVDNTLRAALPYLSRHVVHEMYMPWNTDEKLLANVMYVYRHQDDFGTPHIYTDLKNRSFLDRP